MGERSAWLVTAGAVALAWATATGTVFQYDDFRVVVDNPDVHSWAAWLASMPGIRPLTKASFTLNWTLSPAAAGFVAFNAMCHAASALLVLALVRRWLPALAPGMHRPGLAALVAALVFALHPAQTEAVTWIAGRSVALSGCLYLAALLAWERAGDAPRPGARIALSAALYAGALAARETAWTLPFAVVLVETARGESFRSGCRRALPLFGVLAAALAAMAASPVYRRLLATSLDVRDPVANLFAQVEGISYLVTHPLLTLRVNFDPDLAAPATADAQWWLAATLIAVAIGSGFAQLRRRPWLGLAPLWFLLHLVPTNGPIARYDLANDRQLYLALVGPALVAGIVVARMRPAVVGGIAAAALVAALGIATFARNADYASEIALWEATARASPAKARPWNNVGWAHQQAGDLVRARAAYERALELDPFYFRARGNLDALPPR
ncbi:MAG: tetratricopeptide repeat protein [Betaproteobacteria bacterium]